MLGTLDTKGDEYAYVRDRVTDAGVEVLVVDAGILGVPRFVPDVSRQEVAAAAGEDVQALADARDRPRAIEAMGRGAAEVVQRLHAEGRLRAIGALGGTGGTAIATKAMRALPIGVPKRAYRIAGSAANDRELAAVVAFCETHAARLELELRP